MSESDSITPATPPPDSETENPSDEVLTESHPEATQRPRRPTHWILVGVAVLLAVAAVPCWNALRASAVAESLQDCQAAQNDRDWEQLQQASHRWLWWQPRSGQAIVYRALSHEQMGELDQAVELLETIPDDDDFVFAGLIAQIDILLARLSRPSQAEASCRRILRLEPAATIAHLRLFHIYSITLQHQKLHDQIREAIALRAEPTDAWPMLFQLDELIPAKGYSTVTRWKIREPDNESLIVAQAIYAREQLRRNRQTLRDHVEVAAARFPKNSDLLAYRVSVAVIEGDIPLAISLLEMVPDSARSDPRFWRLKALVHEDRNEIEPAVAAIRKSLELYPLSWRSQQILARLLLTRGERGESTKLVKQSSEGKSIDDELNLLSVSDEWLTAQELPRRMVDFARLSREPDVELLDMRISN